MKRTFCKILIIIVLYLSFSYAYAEDAQIKLNNKTNLNLQIDTKSIESPSSLGSWYPPPVENPFLPNNNYYGNTVIPSQLPAGTHYTKRPFLRASAISLPVIIGGGLLYIVAKHSKNYILIPPIINANQSNTSASVTSLDDEKLFTLTIDESKSLPLHNNYKLFIKLSDNMDYKPESSLLNSDKLTDEEDSDILFYDKDNKTLIFDIKNNEIDFPLSLSFIVLPNTPDITIEKDYCLVKYANSETFDNIEWSKIPVLEEK